jgi:hypothetical protein
MRDLLKNTNLAIRFVLELCMLAAFTYWGYHITGRGALKIIAAIGSPLIAAIIWGLFLSPKAKVKLILPVRVLMELILFCTAGWLLYNLGKEMQGLLLGGIFIVNRILLLLLKA